MTCHGWVVRLGYEGYVIVGSSLVEFYVKSGAMDEARWVFSNMPFRDSGVWNVMISGYGRAGFYAHAMNCFSEMLLNGVKIDCMTVPRVLNSCRREGDLMKGKQVHGNVEKSFTFDVDAATGNALIEMYGKCGCLQDSEKVFRSMCHVNLVTWTTVISCYGIHGKGYESWFLFKKMIPSGFTPNSLTLTAIGSCSHSGLIDQGWQIFNSIHSDYGFGYLVEALELLKTMKSLETPNVWGALLSGCMMHRKVAIGEIATEQLFQLEPNNASNEIALCSIYESRWMLDKVSKVRVKIKELGLVRAPGCS